VTEATELEAWLMKELTAAAAVAEASALVTAD